MQLGWQIRPVYVDMETVMSSDRNKVKDNDRNLRTEISQGLILKVKVSERE